MKIHSKLSLCGMHLFGNGLLLLLGYYWLGLGESDLAHLALSAATILLFALAAIWLHGTALVLFRQQEGDGLKRAALRTLRHLFPLVALGAGVLLIYSALIHFDHSFEHEAFKIGSYTTMRLRRPVEPGNVLRAFHVFIWILEWIVVPVLAFPLASEVANSGWSGFTPQSFRRSKQFLFWIEAGLLVVAAIHLPIHLYLWIPTMSNFSMEALSVSLRIAAGYLIFTLGILAVEFFASAGNPRTTQPSTVVSP